MTDQAEPAEKQVIIDVLKPQVSLAAVYLFGSRAQGNASKSSDYDIAVLCEPQSVPNFDQQLELKGVLEDALSADVDLIILNHADPIIAIQVLTKGLVLTEENRKLHQEYITRIFAEYAELKEIRAPMERNILKRKYYDR